MSFNLTKVDATRNLWADTPRRWAPKKGETAVKLQSLIQVASEKCRRLLLQPEIRELISVDVVFPDREAGAVAGAANVVAARGAPLPALAAVPGTARVRGLRPGRGAAPGAETRTIPGRDLAVARRPLPRRTGPITTKLVFRPPISVLSTTKCGAIGFFFVSLVFYCHLREVAFCLYVARRLDWRIVIKD